MSNRLLTTSEVVVDMVAAMDGLPPKHKAWFLYTLQTGLGGFPRDKAEEARINAMPDDGEAVDAWLRKHDA